MGPRRFWFLSLTLLSVYPLIIGCSGGNSSGGGSQSTGPAVRLSASSLTFTGVDSGYRTGAQSITLTNSGSASLILGTETLSGADASYFGGSAGGGVGGCANLTLAPGDSCTSEVSFEPIAARTYSAALSFSDNANNSPQTVALSGNLGAAPAPLAQAKFAYVGTSQQGIFPFTISSNGTWTALPVVGGGGSPGAMVIDPLGKFLFLADFLSGDITSFSINQSTGGLTQVNSAVATNSNNRPENMAIDPTGTFIYVSNTGMGTVDEYTVNRTTGAVTYGSSVTVPLATTIQPGNSEPSALTTDPTGQYLYVSEIGYMAAYSINSQTGALTPLPVPNLQGGICFNLRLDPTGKYLYCTAGESTGIFVYAINSSNGALSSIGGPVPTGQGPTDIGFTFNSKYAYVANGKDGTFSLYNDNPSTGLLTAMTPSTFTQGGGPFQIAIDPGDQFAYVVLETAGINLLSINADGTLSYFNNISVPAPVALAIYPSHP
jgi:6-phosphogluconolactonase (cycloisomerase 2 family)